MKTLTPKQAFGRELPRWPQLKLTGRPVSIAHAKDIIFRTDTFLASPSRYGEGNNKAWAAWARKTLGYSKLVELEELSYDRGNDISPAQVHELINKAEQELGVVRTTYVHNTWAASCYVHGPYGWCWPDGQLCFVDNVGKNPTVQEVYNDLVTLWTAFPYICVTATLMDREHSEPGAQPIITLVVNTTGVHFTDEHEKHHYPVKAPIRHIDDVLTVSEQGLPDEWIVERGEYTRPLIDRLIAESGLKYPTSADPEPLRPITPFPKPTL